MMFCFLERHRILFNIISILIFQAVDEVCSVEKSNEQHMLNPSGGRQWINPSKRLVDKAIDRWTSNNLRADNTSVVTGKINFLEQKYIFKIS